MDSEAKPVTYRALHTNCGWYHIHHSETENTYVSPGMTLTLKADSHTPELSQAIESLFSLEQKATMAHSARTNPELAALLDELQARDNA